MADTKPSELQPYVAAGWRLIPLRAKDKRPRDKDWTKIPYKDEDQVAHMEDGGNVGVRLTAEQLVIDVDPRRFPDGETLVTDNPYARLCADLGIDPERYPTVETGSGGLHVYMLKPSGAVRGSLGGYDGVEFKALNQQVVAAGSIHPDTGRLYEWDFLRPSLADAPVAPASLLAAIGREATAANASEGGGEYAPEEVARMLDPLDPEEFRDQSAWLELMMACHHASGGDARAEFIEWSTRDPQYSDDAGVIGGRWDSLRAKKSGGITFRTLLKALTDRGLESAIPRTPPEDDFDDDIEHPETETDSSRDLPEIRVKRGDRIRMLEDAKKALFDAFPGEILQRHGELVRPVRLGDRSVEGSIVRHAGSTVLLPVTALWLEKAMGRSARWYTLGRQEKAADGSPGKLKRSVADAPSKIASMIIHDQGDWPFHHVRGMVAAPTVDVRTGRIVGEAGIDPETGLLAVFDAGEFRAIEAGVGRDGAAERLRRAHHALFRDMPFEDEPSRAVAMSALVTALVRPTMRAAPMHLFDAAMPGTGKSKMASVVGVVATGVEPSASAWAGSEEENEKRLAALLRKGDPVVLFDNLDAARGDRIGGNMLNIVLTQDPASIRVLGKTEEETLNTRVTMLATGNNIAVNGDTCRRAVKCRLDAGCAEPERRRFDWDPVEAARTNRASIVADLLEALAAYIGAGRPCDPDPIGSFEDWTPVRGLLLWCGFADPAETMADVKATDASRADVLAALETWYAAYEDRWVTAAELEEFVADKANMDAMLSRKGYEPNAMERELGEAIETLRDTLFDGNAGKVWIGKTLLRSKGVAAGDYHLQVERGKRASRFRVVQNAA